MLTTEQDQLRGEIEAWAETYGCDRGALIPILQEIQRRHARVSDFAMQIVADVLDIHPVEVYGVVSFYSLLDWRPKGHFVIRLCRTISCDMRGKSRLARQLESELGISFGESTPDGQFTLEWANCIGMCDQGPALLVNDHVFTRVTPNKANEIVEGCRKVFGVHAAQTTQEQLV